MTRDSSKERRYRLRAGPDGALDKIVSEDNLRSEIHGCFCSCGNPLGCDNEYLAEFDENFPEQGRSHGWDLEDGFVKFEPIVPESKRERYSL